jgi:hypothetical protein
MANYKLEPDNRIPLLAGETRRDFKTYEKTVAAHVLNMTAKDKEELEMKKAAVGPVLYKNLLRRSHKLGEDCPMWAAQELVGAGQQHLDND